jgi:hypothetical protein
VNGLVAAEEIRLLAFPGYLSATLAAGGPNGFGAPFYTELGLALLVPLSTTIAVLSILRKGSERALVLPTPLMLWLVTSSQRSSISPWPQVLAQGALLALLYACWRQRRGLAQWAVIACGAAAGCLQVSGMLQK